VAVPLAVPVAPATRRAELEASLHTSRSPQLKVECQWLVTGSEEPERTTRTWAPSDSDVVLHVPVVERGPGTPLQ
jgi:hypothetical protein